MQLRSGNISLVSFAPKDTEIVYEIRNHPSVRNFLRNTRPIPWNSHLNWVEENLVIDKKLLLFIVLQNDTAIGIALLRNFEGKSAEIGVMIKYPKRHARAAYRAAQVLGHYAFEYLHLDTLYSNVPLHNEHALAFNQKCGFVPTGEASKHYHRLALTRDASRHHKVHQAFFKRYGVQVIESESD